MNLKNEAINKLLWIEFERRLLLRASIPRTIPPWATVAAAITLMVLYPAVPIITIALTTIILIPLLSIRYDYQVLVISPFRDIINVMGKINDSYRHSRELRHQKKDGLASSDQTPIMLTSNNNIIEEENSVTII